MSIKPERVIELIEAYGADTRQWPDEERAAAETLLYEEFDLFADVFASAERLDAAMTFGKAPGLSSAAIGRIAATAPFGARSEARSVRDILQALFRPGRAALPGAMAFASLAFGLFLGYAGALSDPGAANSADDAFYAALDAGYITEFSEDAS